MRSIRRTLLLWLFIGLSSGIALAAALLYVHARDEANQIFDYQMQQLAASLPSRSFAPVSPGRYADPGMERDIVIQIWGENGVRIYHSHEQPSLPQRAELGFSNVATPGGMWRIYSAQQGDTVVQVAQPMSARRDLAARVALKTVAPLLLLFPFLGVLVWATVSKGLAPVKHVAMEVGSRDAGALLPVTDADLPQEIRPLTHALNELLERLGRAIDAQRAFIADAAHELRTPLTALKLRIQLAERATDEAERKAAFEELKQGFERALHTVQQLLTLARHEPGASEPVRRPVDLRAIAGSAAADFAQAAAARRIDLEVTGADAAVVEADPDALRIMLDNLLDNAIRYTREGGRVEVSLSADASSVSIAVQDNGPGIPGDEARRVFDRFYRIPGTQAEGSGLGLAIVKRIADAHGARLEAADANPGLRVSIIFPRA